jgi:hypothetical protein
MGVVRHKLAIHGGLFVERRRRPSRGLTGSRPPLDLDHSSTTTTATPAAHKLAVKTTSEPKFADSPLEEGRFEPSVPLAKEWVLWRSCRDVLPMPEMPQFDAPGILGSACPWKPRLILKRHLPCAGGSAVGIHTATLPAATPFLADPAHHTAMCEN